MVKDEAAELGAQLLSPTIQKVALPVVSFTLMIFFLIQGPFLFGESWERWEIITIVYLLMVIVGTFLTPAVLQTEAWRVFLWFGIALAGGLALFGVVFSQFKYTTTFPVGNAFAMVIFQVFVITYSEEIFFRAFLAERLRALPSAVIFSVFHLAVYSAQGLNFGAFFTAFVFGILFAFVYFATKERAGVGAVWGLHAAWNLALLFL